MKITPLDVEQYDFSKSFSGYNPKEVRELLRNVQETLEALIEENQKLKEELRLKEAELAGVRGKETLLNETLITTQKACEDLRVATKKEATCMLSEAELQADQILRSANERLVKLMDEIAELKKQRISFETDLRRIIDMHNKFLDAMNDDDQADENHEGKFKVLTKQGV